jgi:hypothetical protein
MRVDFETSKLLKDLGFAYHHVDREMAFVKGEEGGNWCYNTEGKLINPKLYNPKNKHYPAPLQYHVQKWLREQEYLIHISHNDFEHDIRYGFEIVMRKVRNKMVHPTTFNTYETALQESILISLYQLQYYAKSNT